MTPQEFKDLVKQMRKAQINYFKTPSLNPEKRRWLDESKKLEKLVDAELSDQKTMEF